MNLKEALSKCKSKKYPDIFYCTAGLFEVPELNVVGIPKWGRFSKTKRKVILKISTYRGISSDAIHYYGKLEIDGVYTGRLDNPEVPRNLTSKEHEKYPLYDYIYEIEIVRPLTQDEIDSNKQRWGNFTTDNFTNAYESLDQLITEAKEIIKLRFTGDWNVFIQYPRGRQEQIPF